MNDASKDGPGAAPGHYGSGYGERSAKPAPHAPDALDAGTTAPAGLEPVRGGVDPDAPPGAARDDGAPVVFTPDDVTVRPPDRTPTESAPASEKVGLIFERS